MSDAAKPLKPLPVDYLVEVSRLIDVNLYYPWQAKRNHDQGRAIVHIVLARDGTVLAVHLIQGTDYPSLDQEACQVVLRVHKFPGLPADILAGVNQFAIDQPVRFHLY